MDPLDPRRPVVAPDGQGPPAARARLVVGWLVLVALVNGLLWMALVPPWQTPDEPKHFEYVRLLAEGDRLVAFDTEAEAADPELQAWIVRSMDAHRFWWYGSAPGYDPARPSLRFADLWLGGSHTAFYRSSPAYYWLVSRLQPADRMAGLYVARLWSVALAALGVLLLGMAARALFADDPLVRYGAPALAALHPMAAFLAGGVNNDALVNTLAMLAFAVMARLLARGGGAARLLVLAGAVGAAVAVKRTALFLVPTAATAVGLWLVLRARARPARVAAAAGAAAVLAAAGWAWWSSGGAAAVPAAWRQAADRYLFNEPDQLDRIVAYLRAPETGGILVEYLWGLHNGFWGSFGWQMVDLPAPAYAALGTLTAVAALGAARRVLGGRDPGPRRALLALSALAVALAAGGALLFFVAYLDLPYAPPPQGRYLFAALGPAAILLTAGLSAWIPPARRPAALAAWFAALVAFDALALFGVVVPYFYR